MTTRFPTRLMDCPTHRLNRQGEPVDLRCQRDSRDHAGKIYISTQRLSRLLMSHQKMSHAANST
jgi:hypothetical protein